MNFNEVQEKISGIFNELNSLKLQMNRIIADAESEKGTRARTNDRIYKDIEKLEVELKDLLYGEDRKTGIVVELDRLNQESLERKLTKKNIFALWIAVGGIIIKELITLLMRK